MEIAGIKVKKVEVARLLGVHPTTLSRMIREDRVPPIVGEYFRLLSEVRRVGNVVV